MDERVKQAYLTLEEARRALHRAKGAYEHAVAEARAAAFDAVVSAAPSMPTRDLGEAIADAVRAHGTACARQGHPNARGEWRGFRRLLGILVERCAALETKGGG